MVDGERRFQIALARAKALEVAGRDAEAAGVYRELAGRWHPRLPKDEVLFRLATVQEQRGPGAGQPLFRHVVLEHAASPYAAEALTRLDVPLSPAEQRQRAMSLYESREYAAAIPLLEAAVARDPKDWVARLALGRLYGRVLREDGDRAVEHLTAVIESKARPMVVALMSM